MEPASEPAKIEDYALIGDFRTAALVSRHGSIDWLCVNRFDSGACFAKLLGDESNGFWALHPKAKFSSKRRYRQDTLVLETDFETADGCVRVTDCMLPFADQPTILRVVKGLAGKVEMQMELVIRFDYGSIVPWVTRNPFGGIRAVAGPDTLRLKTTAPTYGRDLRTFSDFTVRDGESVPFLLSWTPSHDQDPPEISDPALEIERLDIWWQNWIRQCEYEGPHKEAVHRSLITLKALTYSNTGGIIAAPTTSLPEELGGSRNWDYRYCWLRDSTISLRALLLSGYREEALAWRDWLSRAVAGTPEQMSIMYGIDGERRLQEFELPWLKGYAGSRPVRVGNAAHNQFQLDVYGDVLDSFLLGREHGLAYETQAWRIERKILDFLVKNWQRPDRGIWEVRGPERPFTHSKVLAWVAMDRASRSVARHRCSGNGDIEKWRELARVIHDDVCTKGYDPELKSFVQSYGSKRLDASTLMIPLVGFLPADDPRMLGTVERIQSDLMEGGFVRRYTIDEKVDGIEGGEGVFLPCSLWLVDNWCMQGRVDQARELFERVMSVQNDVGLLAEEYDPSLKRQLGNFPQAFTHVGVINSAFNLAAAEKSGR